MPLDIISLTLSCCCCYYPDYLNCVARNKENMSGHLTPSEAAEATLPDDVFINPDTLPPVSTAELAADEQDVAPARGKKNKLKGFIKKGKKDKKSEPPGISALADALGKSRASSTSSKEAAADVLPVLMTQQRETKPSRMSSFKGFFAKKPAAADVSDQPAEAGRVLERRRAPLMRESFRKLFRGSPAVSPPVAGDHEAPVVPLKELPPGSACRMSVFMFGLFGVVVIIGIVLVIFGFTGNSRKAEHCLVIGPIFLLLGCFVMIGHAFFVLFWVDDPLPCLNECMAKINSKIGGVPDPYGLKRPETYVTQRTSYYPGLRLSTYMPPASPNAKETIPMKNFSAAGQMVRTDGLPG